MNEKNIEALSALLVQLGFEPSVELELRCRICFSPEMFELVRTEVSGEDFARFSVRIEMGESGLYRVICYQAVLRKANVVPKNLQELDHKMSLIDWKGMAYNQVDSMNKSMISQAFTLLKELQGIDSDMLKFKYWADTPLETLMPNLVQLKNRFEITERFYLLDPAHMISFAEAKRFLQSKWMERQVSASKKLLLKKSEDTKQPSAGNGKLLEKNPRGGGRKRLLKKT